MSSDGYFDGDDEFDASALAQLDAIEAAHFSPGKKSVQRPAPPLTATSRPGQPTKEDSFYDLSFNADEGELAELDIFVEDAYQGKAKPVARPFSRTTSSNTVQTTLFGEKLQPSASSSTNKSRVPMQKTKSVQRTTFGQPTRKTKQWDQTAFAKSGVKQLKPKNKGKGKAGDEGDSDEETVEFEQFPAPFVSLGPPPPMKLAADLLEAKHWIYPLNKPKRDYQYNIVKHCLFENTLVALPTGLGKTFIAGVVMLNYYRWFPEGKVIFVAPTKPLVAQQIVACHETCGIPGSDSIELNGEVPSAMRQRYWAQKRVFFMTPQTLVNDLLKGTCDARDIVLLVVDEAHRASGNYAYNQAIRYLMAKNPHFRVLALTATPGNNPEDVQTLIDGLHISHIEIRNEESIDLKQYTHNKIFIPHIIKPTPPIIKVRDMLADVMKPLLRSVAQAGLLRPNESPISIHPYRPQALMQTLQPQQRGLYVPLSMLSKLARAMMYLLTGSIESCFEFLIEASKDVEPEEGDGGKKKAPKGKKLKDDPQFRILMQELEMQRAVGFAMHPKCEELLNILIQHFGKETDTDDTRVMVFSSSRPVVDRLVEELNKHKPLLRPARFIGQGTDKNGKKGLSQKEQLQVIEKFTAGEYNVLVATCIGEEGLDIGELDITICYDADKAPTRMIQRFGRTGRKREGTIHALLAEDREELNIEKAEAKYREVQKLICKGELYELYADVERLLPAHVKPDCVEKVVEIEKYVREKNSPKKKAPAGQGTKRKRNDDISRNIPDGASKGFVSVRDLVTKAPSKTKKPKKVAISKDFEACGQDDETDEEIESGRIIAPPRRTQSAAAGPSTAKSTAGKTKLRKSATLGGANVPPKPRAKKKKKVEEPTLSQFSKQGADDSDDMDIELGAVSILTKAPTQSRRSRSAFASSDEEMDVEVDHIPAPVQKKSPRKKVSTRILSATPEPSTPPPRKGDESVIELTDSEYPSRPASPEPDERLYETSPSPVRPSPSKSSVNGEDMGWIVDDDDDLQIEIVDSSPLAPKRRSRSPFHRMHVGDESIEVSRPINNNSSRSSWGASATLVDDSVEFVEPPVIAGRSKGKGKERQIYSASSSPEVLASKDGNRPSSLDSPIRKPTNAFQTSTSPLCPSSSPLYPKVDKMSMPPPALPSRFLASAASPLHDLPEPTYPVRPLGHQAKRRRVAIDEDEPESDSTVDAPPPSQRRLHRIESTPLRAKERMKQKSKPKSGRSKPSLLSKNVNLVFDGEAAHSGDEVSEGDMSGSEDDIERESDRMFIKDSPATQVSQSYEQTQMYRRSLMTQAGGVLGFANGPIRGRPFGRIDGPRMQYGLGGLPSSSPPPEDEEMDRYELGSFVVDDDEDISYAPE